MRFEELEAEWDHDNIEHVAQHSIEPEEVEEVVYEDCYSSWVVRGRAPWSARASVDPVRPNVGRPLPGRRHRTVRAAWRVARGDRKGHGAADSTEVSAVAQKLTAGQRRALREEARQWDQLGDEQWAQAFDAEKPVHLRLRRPPPKTLTVALDAQTLNRLRRIARRKQVGPRQLAAIWIAERLGREQATAVRQRRTG